MPIYIDFQKIIERVQSSDASLTSINLELNTIGNEDAQALSEVLKMNTTLMALDLGCNEIGDKGAQALAEALIINATLRALDLQGSEIGDEGAQALAEALKMNTTLSALDLGCNEIGDKGAQAFAEALIINATLSALHLQGNEIGDEGAQALAEALKMNATLSALDFRCNEIGDEGAQALAEALKMNATLSALDLGCNEIGDKGAQAFAEALIINATLSALHLGFNDNIGNKGDQTLADALENNFSILEIEGVLNPNIERILARNKVHRYKFDRLSTLIDLVFNDHKLTTEEKEEFDSLLIELPKTPPYTNHPYYKRLLERKIEPFRFYKPNSMITRFKLRRTLQLIDNYQFDFKIANQEPEAKDLKPNTVVFMQTKQKYFDNCGVQKEGYAIDTLYIKDRFGKMHARKLQGFNLHDFMHVPNEIPLTTASIQSYKAFIQNELHVRGIVRQFDATNLDNERLIAHAWSQVTIHPLYEAAYQTFKGDENCSFFKLMDFLTRWFNHDVAEFYYENCQIDQTDEQRTIDDGYAIENKLNSLALAMVKYIRTRKNVTSASPNKISSPSFFRPVQCDIQCVDVSSETRRENYM